MCKYLPVFFLLLYSSFVAGQESQADIYDFPIKRGGDEWNKLENYQAKRDACQIPSAMLSSLSTEALIATYLNYPILGDLMVFSTLQQGVEKLKENFNGADELLQRKDVGKKLLEKYQAMKAASIDPDWSLVEKGEFSFKMMAIEILLAQENVLSSLDPSSRKYLLKLAHDKLDEKKKNQEVYGYLSYCTVAWIIVRTLEKENYNFRKLSAEQEAQYQSLVNEGVPPTQEVFNTIVSQSQNFLSK